jgi:hypothetical protein
MDGAGIAGDAARLFDTQVARAGEAARQCEARRRALRGARALRGRGIGIALSRCIRRCELFPHRRRSHDQLLPRRGLIQALAALGVLGAGEARAQAGKPLVMVNWGGLANQGFGNFYGAPFVAETPGATVVQDSTGPSTGRIRSIRSGASREQEQRQDDQAVNFHRVEWWG